MNYAPVLSNFPNVQHFYGPGVRRVFLGIYNNILLTTADARQRDFLICAANPGEGGTTVAGFQGGR